MAIIKSGNSSDLLTVEATSKAARVIQYSQDGIQRAAKTAFRMAPSTSFITAAAGVGAFFAITGSGSKVVTVQRILLTVPTLTAVAYVGVLARKWSGGVSGGTVSSSTITALDGSTALSTAVVVSCYSAAPTTGISVGAVGNQRRLCQATTPVAATLSDPYLWDFRNGGESGGVVLRSPSEVLTLAFTAAPATTVAMQLEVEWVEA